MVQGSFSSHCLPYGRMGRRTIDSTIATAAWNETHIRLLAHGACIWCQVPGSMQAINSHLGRLYTHTHEACLVVYMSIDRPA